MRSTLEISCHTKMSAEDILEEIKFPIDNLENFLMALTKMKVDDSLQENEFSAIINTIHHQVVNIQRAVQTP